MAWDFKEANEIYEALRQVSTKVLTVLGCFTEPHEIDGKGCTRTRKWEPINGQKRYRGVLYHYTNGVSGVGALRWGNDPSWGNTGSSWHVTVFDRLPNNVIGELWSKLDVQLLRLFPVPTIIMADWRWGTWHGNWTNNVLLGVENRNGGYSGYNKAKGGLKGLGKQGVEVNGRIWEPYTREQMTCNVNIGRLAHGWVDNQLDPDWVLTHQCVWATKQDAGPLFAIHDVRRAIFDHTPLEVAPWLYAYPRAPDTSEEDEEHWDEAEHLDELFVKFVKWVIPTDEIKATAHDPAVTAAMLYRLGFNTGPEVPSPEALQKQVRWFQRSTGAYADDHPSWVLSPDGVAGPKTHKALQRRFDQLKI